MEAMTLILDTFEYQQLSTGDFSYFIYFYFLLLIIDYYFHFISIPTIFPLPSNHPTTKEHELDSGSPKYQFARETSDSIDTLMHMVGPPAEYTGMIRTAFRASGFFNFDYFLFIYLFIYLFIFLNPFPSCSISLLFFLPDDATAMQFNIPENAFAIVCLKKMAKMLKSVGKEGEATRALTLAEEIEEGLQKYGIIEGNSGLFFFSPYLSSFFKLIFLFSKRPPYEVDGFGNFYFMDDANFPSLLSLPFLEYCSLDDKIYQNTRKMILGKRNPFYSNGTAGEGVGGPHVGQVKHSKL